MQRFLHPQFRHSAFLSGGLLLFFLAALPFLVFAQPESTREKKKLTAELLSYGAEKLEARDYQGAAADFLRARKLDPENPECNVRLAQAYFLLGEYGKSINAVKGLIKTKRANPECYQVYGNAMDMQGKTAYAMKIYKEGLERFPGAGILYMELGIVEWANGNIDSALAHWENGIDADPWFPSNFYYASKACDSLGNRLWAGLYAEFYVNLDRTSERASEMCKLIFDSFRRSITTDSSGLPVLKLTDLPFAPSKTGKTFSQLYEETFSLALRDSAAGFGVETLCDWRDFAYHFWFSNSESAKKKFCLFDWQREIEKRGYLEAYFHWLVYDSAPQEFSKWESENSGYWESFREWFRLNPITFYCKENISRKIADK